MTCAEVRDVMWEFAGLDTAQAEARFSQELAHLRTCASCYERFAAISLTAEEDAAGILGPPVLATIAPETAVAVDPLELFARFGIDGLESLSSRRRVQALAVDLRDAGDFAAAREVLEALLILQQRLVGASSLETLTTVNDLAVMCLDLDDLERARSLLTEASESSTRVHGAAHEQTLTLRSNLADALRNLGALAEAKVIDEEVLKRRREDLGEHDPLVLVSMNNLATTLFEMGDLAGARTLQEDVLRLREEILPPGQTDTTTARANLAATLYQLGELDETLRLERQVLREREEHQGADHLDTWIAKNNLAGTVRDHGDLAEARDLLEEVVEQGEAALGPYHHSVLQAQNNLADLYRRTNVFDRAEALARTAFERRRRKLGPKHAATLLAEAMIAAVLFDRGRTKEAVKYQKRVVSSRVATLGPDHIDSLSASNDLARMLMTLGDPRRAHGLYDDVLTRGRRTLGQQHPDVLAVQSSFAHVCHALGDAPKARELALSIATWLAGKAVVHGDDHRLASDVFGLLVTLGGVPDPGLGPLFASVSAAMWSALEIRSRESLHHLWRHFESFHLTWQTWCLTEAPDELPKALIATQGLEVIVGALPELLSQSADNDADADTDAVRQELVAVRRALGEARARMEQVERRRRWTLSEESEPELSPADGHAEDRERESLVHEERTLIRRYEETKDRLAARQPALAGLLQPKRPTATELERTLGSSEVLVVFWRGPDGSYQAALIGGGLRAHVRLDTLHELMKAGQGYQMRTPRRGGRRAHGERGLTLGAAATMHVAGEAAADITTDVASDLTPDLPSDLATDLATVRERSRACFWDPILAHVPADAELSIVATPGLYSTPWEVGNPGRVVRYFAGLPSYCRLRMRPGAPESSSTVSVGDDVLMAIDPAWETPRPIPFVEVEARLVAEVLPSVRVVDGASVAAEMGQSSGSSRTVIVACHGTIAGATTAGYPILELDAARGLTLAPSRLQASAMRTNEFYCSACVGGLVSETAAGDAFGLVSVLQLLGVPAVIASAAPLPDYFMPIISVLYWYERTHGSPAYRALRTAKVRLREGDWPADLHESIRRAYRDQIAIVLERVALSDPAADERARALESSMSGWLWPDTVARSTATLDRQQRARLAEQLADHLLASRHDLPREDIEHLCGFLVCFG